MSTANNSRVSAQTTSRGDHMEDAKARRSVREQLWLNYYNNTLLEKGVISEEAHRKMRTKIRKRASMKR